MPMSEYEHGKSRNVLTSTMSTRSFSSLTSLTSSTLAELRAVLTSGEGEGATVLICADSTALSTSNSSIFRLLIGNRESVISKTPSFGGCCGCRTTCLGGFCWLERLLFFIGSCDNASTMLSISLDPLLARDLVCNDLLDEEASAGDS